jgi:hypothetical protein
MNYSWVRNVLLVRYWWGTSKNVFELEYFFIVFDSAPLRKQLLIHYDFYRYFSGFWWSAPNALKVRCTKVSSLAKSSSYETWQSHAFPIKSIILWEFLMIIVRFPKLSSHSGTLQFLYLLCENKCGICTGSLSIKVNVVSNDFLVRKDLSSLVHFLFKA